MGVAIIAKKLVTTSYAGRAVCIEDGKIAKDYPSDTPVWEVKFSDDRYHGLCANYYLIEENADKFIDEHGGLNAM